jgi:hypothetical protein
MRDVMALPLLVAAALVLGSSEPAGTEIYKCIGADGKTLFTSDPSSCPGAEAHQSTGRVESIPSTPPASRERPPARRRVTRGSGVAGNEALWRGKKLRAETELRDLELRSQYLYKAVGWCNRGRTLYIEDEHGIRSDYDCKNVDNEYEELKARMAALRLYLDEGLEEECRRAGCLPGWIR